MPLLAVSIDCFCNVEVQRCKESDFLGSGQIASGDLSTRTHTHTHRDKCKISIMIEGEMLVHGYRRTGCLATCSYKKQEKKVESIARIKEK